MKKIAFLAVILSVLAVLVLPFYSYGTVATADKPKEEVVQPKEFISKDVPKEFISKDVPKEVQDLLETLGFAFQGEAKMYYSGKVPGVNDYVLVSFETGHGVVQALFKLSLKKDEKGNINPGEAVSEAVAYAFVDKKVSWYQSTDAKAIFEKAAK